MQIGFLGRGISILLHCNETSEIDCFFICLKYWSIVCIIFFLPVVFFGSSLEKQGIGAGCLYLVAWVLVILKMGLLVILHFIKALGCFLAVCICFSGFDVLISVVVAYCW